MRPEDDEPSGLTLVSAVIIYIFMAMAIGIGFGFGSTWIYEVIFK